MTSVSTVNPDPKQYGKVAVLMGGNSAERPVSLKSGVAVLTALQNQGVDAIGVDLYGEHGDQDPIQQLQAMQADRVFNALHGPGGEDGMIQAVLSMMNIPFTGSGILSSATGMDKLRCKQIWSGIGLPSPTHRILSADMDWGSVINELGLPIIVKPAHEGSSIGMSKVTKAEQLPGAFAKAAEHDDCVFAEQWITGKEFTIGILANKALPVIRLETPHDFYDFDAKYVSNDTQYHFETQLSESKILEVQSLSEQAFKAIGCEGWGRIDVMQSEDGRFWLLEVNTIPGMTDHSLVPMAAAKSGINFEELVMTVLATSMESAD